MSRKNLNKFEGCDERDYRTVVLLLAGLLISFISFFHLHSSQPSTTPARSISSLLPVAFQANLSAEIKPLLFLPVEINQAGGQLLETIPGVGPRLGQRIIAKRREKNGFRDFSELLEVEGIGPQKLASIKKYCTL